MRILFTVFTLALLSQLLPSCKDAAMTSNSFCDTACLKDTLKFVDDSHPLKPYIYISPTNCQADTITWSYTDMGNNRKISLESLLGGTKVKLNSKAVDCFIQDTSYAWVAFNDCSNARGYLLKIPFNKRDKLSVKASAINAFDPKFEVADALVAYSDRGNLFVEDKATGKAAMMTFGEKLDVDYDAIHEHIDSVNITPTRVWAKVKLAAGWKEIEKNIELK